MQRSIIAPAERVTNLRWGIAVLLGIGVFIPMLDWVNLTVGGSAMRREFGVDDAAFGNAVGLAALIFGIAQLPAGLILDRFGVRRAGRITTACWGVIALLVAASGSLAMFAGARGALKLAEAPLPALNMKALGSWFPTGERSLAVAIFDAAPKFAIAAGLPLMSYVVVTDGWRATFLIAGVLGLLFAAAFFIVYRDPSEDKRLTYAERKHVVDGGAQGDAPAPNVFGALGYVLSQRAVWGTSIGFATYGFAGSALLLWMPAYLAQTFHLDVMQTGIDASIPWLVAGLVNLFAGGRLVDSLIARGNDATRVRKSVLVCGMLLGIAIAGTTTAHDPNVAIAYISIPTLIAPQGAVGTVTGVMNFVNVLATVAGAIVAGHLITAGGTFAAIFDVAAGALVAGMLSYVFVLGRIEPIPDQTPAGLLS